MSRGFCSAPIFTTLEDFFVANPFDSNLAIHDEADGEDEIYQMICNHWAFRDNKESVSRLTINWLEGQHSTEEAFALPIQPSWV